ncbi:MAG: protein-L-isoaspartate(D-aspartate) O-methyltransferase [Candidatus Aegiribacteria sp.]
MIDSGRSAKDLRERMVREDIAGQGVTDPGVLEAFRSVPRENFVPEGTGLREVYGNHPYPIGFGQTISQPFIVAYMVEMLGCSPGDRVLEVGTGSGYQTAILAAMGLEVVTVEVVARLARRAKKAVLDLMPEANVSFIVADGYGGWPPGAPYDGIIVSAAPVSVPKELEAQLSPRGGKLVIPAGHWSQSLMLIVREGDRLTVRRSLPVRFVPLVKPGGE